MKQRGFLSLELDAILLLAVVAGIASSILYFMHVGAANERAKQEAVNQKARTERQEMISGLALDLATAQTNLLQSRNDNAHLREEKEATNASLLHDYVPKSAVGASCLRNGFVLYTDAAAAGVSLDSRPAVGLTQAPAAVGDDEEAGIVARNYWKYHACEQRVTDLVTNYDALRTKFNAKVAEINAKAQQQ